MSAKSEAFWNQLCADAGVDPQRRLAARQAVLTDAKALDSCFYRADDNDPEGEELDLGDAKVLFLGPFQAPTDWDAAEREEFFGESDPSVFFDALVECEAEPGSKAFFLPEIGDFVAVMPSPDKVEMYFLHDWRDEEDGCHCVLVRADVDL